MKIGASNRTYHRFLYELQSLISNGAKEGDNDALRDGSEDGDLTKVMVGLALGEIEFNSVGEADI